MATIKELYGLNVQPFKKGSCSEDFVYLSNDLKQASGVVENSIRENGISIICGDSGTGVSFSTYTAYSRLKGGAYTFIYYPVCHVSPRDFYKECCRLMSVTPDGKGRQAMISAIRKKGIEAKRQGYTLVLILDNAQNIPELVTRDLKTIVSEDFGLSNCMALVLSGTREFKSVLRLPENKSLQMDTTLAYTMKGLSKEETKQYVTHKIQKAGGSPDIIDPQVLEELYSLCFNGNCKGIDNMMKTALKFGTQYNREKIDMEVIRAAAAHIANL